MRTRIDAAPGVPSASGFPDLANARTVIADAGSGEDSITEAAPAHDEPAYPVSSGTWSTLPQPVRPYAGMLDEGLQLPRPMPLQATPMRTHTHMQVMGGLAPEKKRKMPTWWILAVIFAVSVGLGFAVTLLISRLT